MMGITSIENFGRNSAASKEEAVSKAAIKLSLDGWSGIGIGLICSFSLWIGLEILPQEPVTDLSGLERFLFLVGHYNQIFILALATFLACSTIGYISGTALNNELKPKVLLLDVVFSIYKLLIPVLVGAVTTAITIVQAPNLTPGVVMLCYGLALHSKLSEIKSVMTVVAFTCIHLGLIGMMFQDLYPVLLLLCFGVCHIAYGVYTLVVPRQYAAELD